VATKMYDDLASGTVLVKSGTMLPTSVESECFSLRGWGALRVLDSTELEGQIRGHGWHFFFIVPAIAVRSVGLSRSTAIAKAIGRAARKVDEQGLNAVEVISLDATRVLEVYAARLHVQPRHIRKDPYIADLKPHSWADWKPEVHDGPATTHEPTHRLMKAA
jgi:hypothetical protein